MSVRESVRRVCLQASKHVTFTCIFLFIENEKSIDLIFERRCLNERILYRIDDDDDDHVSLQTIRVSVCG